MSISHERRTVLSQSNFLLQKELVSGLSWAQATRSVAADTAAIELVHGKSGGEQRASLRRRTEEEEAGHLLVMSVWDTDAYTRNEHPNASTIS